MYEKIKIYFLIAIIFGTCIICSGCRTTRGLPEYDKSGNYAELIAEYQTRITELEAENEGLRNTLSRTRDNVSDIIEDGSKRFAIIRERSIEIRDSEERIEYLLTEYDKEVRRILSENKRLRESLDRREDSERNRKEEKSETN
jgi:chromosome segregation ATPase